jgi:hypothetical protein
MIARGALLLALSSLPTTAFAEGSAFLKKFRDWSAYRHEDGKSKICFATTQPKDSAPADLKRGDVYFYVSFFPGDNVKNEVMIRVGYPVKEGSAVSVSVGSDTFAFFAKSDKAFIEDAEVEKKFVDALKRGDKMQVKAVTEKGVETTDVYSLLGISSATKEAEEACS